MPRVHSVIGPAKISIPASIFHFHLGIREEISTCKVKISFLNELLFQFKRKAAEEQRKKELLLVEEMRRRQHEAAMRARQEAERLERERYGHS